MKKIIFKIGSFISLIASLCYELIFDKREPIQENEDITPSPEKGNSFVKIMVEIHDPYVADIGREEGLEPQPVLSLGLLDQISQALTKMGAAYILTLPDTDDDTRKAIFSAKISDPERAEKILGSCVQGATVTDWLGDWQLLREIERYGWITVDDENNEFICTDLGAIALESIELTGGARIFEMVA